MDQDVKIVIVNKGAHVHNFVLPAFYIYTQNLQPNASTSVGFRPDKTGLYPFFSDTGGSPEAGLSGQIHVHDGMGTAPYPKLRANSRPPITW